MGNKLTPLMQQYWDIKSAHEDKILLFRMGDFFEMFHDDAVTAAPILNIALTQRNKKSADGTPMCGVPHHSISGPILKLLAAGKKIAICDQVEDPKLAKGIVKRAVTRCLSPGMVYDPDTLDQLTTNYLVAFDSETLSFLETSTGEAFFYRLPGEQKQIKLAKVHCPTEVVLSPAQQTSWLNGHWSEISQDLESLVTSIHEIDETLLSQLKGENYQDLPLSCQRLLSYALSMQGCELFSTLEKFRERHLEKRLLLSPTVLRHLEIFTNYKGEQRGSLFQAINRTKTSAGGRWLKRAMQFPLTDRKEIERRLDRVQNWSKNHDDLKTIRKILNEQGDVERRLGKLSHQNCLPRDIESLRVSLSVGISLRPYCEGRPDPGIWQTCIELEQRISQTLAEEVPANFKEGGFIRRGFRSDLDECIRLSEDSQSLLLDLEMREREATGISSLKVRFNNVFGFYIEVTNAHKGKVPGRYLRKQTLANAERFTTEELTELERKVLAAKSQRLELEREIFSELRQAILDASADLLILAHEWSELDAMTALAWLAVEYKYCRPELCPEDGKLWLQASRHPVVEQEVHKRFVPNDIGLQMAECLLLTGPNMAGKSTLMRQVAISVILAQMGSFIPAEIAHMPIFDRLFTRIGASDSLSEGLSTFMVEMKETAELLKESSSQSLVILDEVGRGTSTYDGMCLAQAILEFLVENKRVMTLFATHYHELTQLERKSPRIINAHMAIVENSGEIEFLHTLVRGPANRSYGIQVAKLAGLPKSVTQRAQSLLKKIEDFQSPSSGQMTFLDLE